MKPKFEEEKNKRNQEFSELREQEEYMNVYDLKVMHMENPVIDQVPEFSWKISSEKQNVLQAAYRIVVQNGEKVLWDTGKVLSREQTFII